MSFFIKIIFFLIISMCLNLHSFSIQVSHSSLHFPLVHIGQAKENELVSKLLQDHKRRKKRNFPSSSFLQQRHALTLHTATDMNLPLKKQCKVPSLVTSKKNIIPTLLSDIPQKRLSTFFGPIGIGQNELNQFSVMFDTGSCEIWVPDESCITLTCSQRRKYHHSNELNTMTRLNNNIFIQYLSGTLSAYQKQISVSLDRNITLQNQTVDFATHLDIPLLQDIQWDGILGLGFRNEEQVKRHTYPFIETIKKENILKKRGLRNQFAYYISSPEGSFTLGGANLHYTKEGESDFIWASVDSSRSYWGVHVKSVIGFFKRNNTHTSTRLDNASWTAKNASYLSILDTGTFLIYSPSDFNLEKLSQIMDTSVSCEEKKSKLPILQYTLQGVQNNDITLTLTPSDYVLQQQGDCTLGIVEDDADDELGGWTFGHIFLKTYYTIFDADVPAAGFAKPIIPTKHSEST